VILRFSNCSRYDSSSQVPHGRGQAHVDAVECERFDRDLDEVLVTTQGTDQFDVVVDLAMQLLLCEIEAVLRVVAPG
jgi:hypothetical protein